MSAFPAARSAQPHRYSPHIPGGYQAASTGMNHLSPPSPSAHVGCSPLVNLDLGAIIPLSIPPPHSTMDPSGHGRQMKGTRTNSSSEEKTTTNSRGACLRSSTRRSSPATRSGFAIVFVDGGPGPSASVRQGTWCLVSASDRSPDCVSQLEAKLKEGDFRIRQLESQLQASRHESMTCEPSSICHHCPPSTILGRQICRWQTE